MHKLDLEAAREHPFCCFLAFVSSSKEGPNRMDPWPKSHPSLRISRQGPQFLAMLNLLSIVISPPLLEQQSS
jgi:hypothetical protein